MWSENLSKADVKGSFLCSLLLLLLAPPAVWAQEELVRHEPLFVMPKVVGLSLEQARDKFPQSYEVGTLAVESPGKVGEVFRVAPPEGRPVYPGQSVILFINAPESKRKTPSQVEASKGVETSDKSFAFYVILQLLMAVVFFQLYRHTRGSAQSRE